MSVRQRTWKSSGEAKTAWVADFKGTDGKRRLRHFPTRLEAVKFLEGKPSLENEIAALRARVEALEELLRVERPKNQFRKPDGGFSK